MREFIEEVTKELLKGFKTIMDDVIDKFLKDFRNDLKVVQKWVPIGSNQKRDSLLEPPLSVVSTELVETKQEPLLTCSAEDHVFDELFMITNEESDDIEDFVGRRFG
ncbi:hypothetical protein V6N11_044688 [Hibiscus sabdariffa]|uniref:Uncharacterized protein n=1 Tax=Hibiscus sabdariffa TaxID=183260 RepID=A0ABR1ZKV6_9ROSI